jgi:hypothetical protein
MNEMQRSNPTSRYPVTATLRIALVTALAVALYAAVTSQTRIAPVEAMGQAVASPAQADQAGGRMPAPSSTATEGNVVDLTYPVN